MQDTSQHVSLTLDSGVMAKLTGLQSATSAHCGGDPENDKTLAAQAHCSSVHCSSTHCSSLTHCSSTHCSSAHCSHS